MLDKWLPFLIYGLFAAAIPASMIVISFVFSQRPRARTPARGLPFESGVSVGPPKQQRFTISFYLTAMLFIVFDIELVEDDRERVEEHDLDHPPRARLVRFRRTAVLHRNPRPRLRVHLAQ